jgi:hypothetical protein
VEEENSNVVTGALQSVLSGFIKLALLAGVVLYSGLVLMTYSIEGPRRRPRYDLRHPANSARDLAVWLGVEALVGLVRLGTPIFGLLSEASADVGEWFLSRTREARSEK